jgi:hypothetical protein
MVSSLDNWNFYEGLDVNNTGNIFYVNGDFAVDQKLVFLNDAGNTVIRVDNFTDGTGNSSFLRNTVKILSDYTVYIGDLVLLDAVHMPFGVCTYPWISSITAETSHSVLSLACILDPRPGLARQRRNRYYREH